MFATVGLGLVAAMVALVCFGAACLVSPVMDHKIVYRLYQAGSFLATIYGVTLLVLILRHTLELLGAID